MAANLLNKVFCSDSRQFLRKIPDNFVTLVYLDPPFYSDRNYEVITKDGSSHSFSDKWSDGLDGYLEFMSDILTECKRILNDKGSLYLHCDWHASHYLKVELDKIFGYNNFRMRQFIVLVLVIFIRQYDKNHTFKNQNFDVLVFPFHSLVCLSNKFHLT